MVTERRLYVNNTDYELIRYEYDTDPLRVSKEIRYTDLNGTGDAVSTRYVYTFDGNQNVATKAQYSHLGVTHYEYVGTSGLNLGAVTKTAIHDGSTSNPLVQSQASNIEVGPDGAKVALLGFSRNAYGAQTDYAYDNYYRLTKQTQASPSISGTNDRMVYEYEFDGPGRMTREKRGALGSSTRVVTYYEYDSNRNMVTLVEDEGGIGARTAYEYDAYGYLSKVVDPEGHVRKSIYTDAGFLQEEIAYDENSTDALAMTTYSYDDHGWLTRTAVADDDGPFSVPSGGSGGPEGWIYTDYRYDPYGRQTLVIQDSGGLNLSTQYEYDNQNRVIKTTTPGGVWTRIIREGRGLVKNEIMGYPGSTSATEMTTTYSYDEDANLREVISPSGQMKTYEYDGLGRRTKTIDN